MERLIVNNLIKWKEKKNRKPLILNGARQTGKTWILKEFGKKYFKSFAYIRFDNNETARNIFEQDFNIERIISQLSLLSDVEIVRNETLIIFDEIQECPKALTSLKYFCEDASEYFVAAAGSLLGIKLSAGKKEKKKKVEESGTGFPVGKVEYLDMYPMSFKEFLIATNKGKYIPFMENNDWATIKTFGDDFRLSLKKYFVVGGMPEVVSVFIEGEDYKGAREVQKRILRDYENDFSKHAFAEDAPKIKAIWDSVPIQLAKENKRFVYSETTENGCAKTLDTPLNWLVGAGLLNKVKRVTVPEIPLASYEDGAFKLYFLDVGLLCAKADLSPKTILDGNRVFTEFKGSLTEQYVNQELKSEIGLENLYYWTGRNAEIDFLIQKDDAVIPIEVKAEMNLQAKSLRFFCEKYKVPLAFRFSMSDYNTGEYPFGTKLIDVPLFALNIET